MVSSERKRAKRGFRQVYLPTSVKIGGIEVRVEVNSSVDALCKEENFYGFEESKIDKPRRIGIYSRQSKQEMSNTVLHELLEVINSVALGKEISHTELTSIVTALHQVFEDIGLRLLVRKIK